TAKSSGSASGVLPQRAEPPRRVPDDKFDELKQFLDEPATAGPAMERAKQIVREMMQHHVFPGMPGEEATVMLMVADAMEDRVFALEVYARLRDAGVSPSPLTLELTALACAELGDWQTAGEVVEFMHQAIDWMHPSSSIYENAIAACCRANTWMRAKHFLDEMLSYRLEAAPEVHEQCIALCVAANELTATDTLLRRYLSAYDFETDALEAVLNELFGKAIAAASLDHALYFRDQLRQRKFALSLPACADLVQLYAVERKWHDARALLAQFHGAAPPSAPKSSQYTRDIRALLNDMVFYGLETGLPLYNAALRNYARLDKTEDVQYVFAAMKQQGVEPDAVSYAAAIAGCGADVAGSEQLFQEAINRGCVPTRDVYHAFLLVPSRARAWQQVLERYHAIATVASERQELEQDARVQSLVAVAHGRLQQSQHMLQVFTGMKVRGLRPNLYVYGEAMYAYIRQSNWRHALLLFEHIHQEDFAPHQLAEFSMIWDAAVDAAVQGGKLDRAAALFHRIVSARARISPHTAVALTDALKDVPAPTLWDAFKRMSHLHRVRKSTAALTSNNNPRVLNAVLKRAVDERDVHFAQQAVNEAERELGVAFNSMTYALMLRLYADKELQASFHEWSERMAGAGAKITIFTYRAVLKHLKSLSSGGCEDPAYFVSIQRLLGLNVDEASGGDADLAVRIGGLVLDAMERRGLVDALSLEYYLRLSPDLRHTSRVLRILEAASEFQFSSNLLYTLFAALGSHPESARVRAFLIRILEELPRELSDDALTAYCSSTSSANALALLETLLLEADYEVADEQLVLFLVGIAPPDSNESGEALAVPPSSDGRLPRLARVLKDADATLGSGSMAFLIQRVIGLSKCQQQQLVASGGNAGLDADLDAVSDLLVYALNSYSPEQVREFLSKVVPQADFWCLERILDALD
ncbi:hypothetical protein PybrP1_010819, partial [[Pythium] brassicae (nom. inval.)]